MGRCLIGCFAALALVLPSSAAAALPSPGTDGRGVRVVLTPQRFTLVFERAAAGRYRRLVGHGVQVACVLLDARGREREGGFTGGFEGLPRRRRPVWLEFGRRDPSVRADVCFITGGADYVEIASVPITPRGVDHLDERWTARRVVRLTLARLGPDGELARAPRLLEVVRGVVPLAGPDAAPPGRRLGYWSGGPTRVYAAMRTRAGRLLYAYVDADADEVRTNVLRWVDRED